LGAPLAEDVGEVSKAEEPREESVEDEAAAKDTNCSGGKVLPDGRGEVEGRGARRCLSSTTVRVDENPGVACSTALALAANPEGRDKCCAVKPGSRDFGLFEGMLRVVEFARRNVPDEAN
jgi:hypothetical protein